MKDAKAYVLKLVHAYVDAQEAQVRDTINSWKTNSSGKDTGHQYIKFALLHAVEDMVGYIIASTKGIRLHYYTAEDYVRAFKDHTPQRE